MNSGAGLAAVITQLQARLAEAARAAGRDPAAVRLVAVSKTFPAEAVAAAAACGLRDFGENRLEEAVPKRQRLAAAPFSAELRWHMIGHVQSRKARDVAEADFALVHSLDSLKLADRLGRFAQAAGRSQPVLLECNVSGEVSKAGFAAHDPAAWDTVLTEFGAVLAQPGLRVRGLMTMAPLGTDHVTARPFFARLRALQAAARARWPQAEWDELSMGMTDDFEGAVAEGATLVRVGRAIFGERS